MAVSLSIRNWILLALIPGLLLQAAALCMANGLFPSIPPQVSFPVGIAGMLLMGYTLIRNLIVPVRRANRNRARLGEQLAHSTIPRTGISEFDQMSSEFLTLRHRSNGMEEDLQNAVKTRTKELHQNSQVCRSSFDSLPDPTILIASADHRILAANKAAEDFFQIPGGLAGMETRSFVRHARAFFQDSPQWAKWWELKLDNTVKSVRRWKTTKEKGNTLEISSIPVTQGIEGTLWTFRDVSSEEAFADRSEQKVKIDAVGRFAEGVANDFYNALSAISGSLDMAAMQVASDESPLDTLEICQRACERASKVGDRLLGISARPQFEMTSLRLEDVLSGTIRNFRTDEEYPVEVEVDLSPDLPPLQGNASGLHQLFLNLFLNSRDAMPEGGKIFIRATKEEIYGKAQQAPGTYVRIEVEDRGPGIPSTVRPHLFEPFITTKKGAHGGLGLGLFQVFGIVESHDGWIECHSEPGRGATFEIHLPISYASPSRELRPFPGSREEGSPRPRTPQTTPSGRILVVDDDPLIRKMAKDILQRDGHQVATTSDGAEALALLKTDHANFDLVLLDLAMPKVSGAEALEVIKENWPGLPVVVWSGYSEDAARVLGSGPKRPEAFLQKPVRAARLCETVSDLLFQKSTAA